MKVPIDKVIDCKDNIYLVTKAAIQRAAMISRFIDKPEENLHQLDVIAEAVSDVLDKKIKIHMDEVL